MTGVSTQRPRRLLDSWLPVAGIVAVSALANFLFIGRPSLDIDESYTLHVARLSWSGLLRAMRHGNANMSLYYGVMHLWRGVGESEALLRAPSAVFAVATVPVVYWLGRRLFNARIGLLVRNSPGVRIMNNRITGVTVFGISVRGLSPGVVGNDNTIAGKGLQAVDTRGGANPPLLTTSDVSGWQHRSSMTLLDYLRYHPILTTWLVILLLAALASLVARLRTPAPRPYIFTAAWSPAGLHRNGSSAQKAPLTLVATPAVRRRTKAERELAASPGTGGPVPAAGVARSADP